MNLQGITRRNRFKKRAAEEKPRWDWRKLAERSRIYARRSALLGGSIAALAALTWALDRPIRVISTPSILRGMRAIRDEVKRSS